MFISLVFIAIILLIVYNLYKYLTFWKHIDIYPGPKALPFVGNAHQIGTNPREYLNQLLIWWKQYDSGIYRVWIGQTPYLIITDPKDVEAVLTSNTLLKKADVYDLLQPWLGDGLLTSHGTKWFKHRKMITPSFHFKILCDFLDVMNRNSLKFVKKLEQYAITEKKFDIEKLIHYSTLDVICETAMGIDLNSLDDPQSKIVTAFQEMCYTVQTAAFNPIKRNPKTFKFTEDYRKQKNALNILKNFTYKVIENRRNTLQTELENDHLNEDNNSSEYMSKKKLAFLDTLLTATLDNKPLTSKEIFEEVSTFMFEGHDTTTSGISFAIYILSRRQDIQQNVYEEQKKFFTKDDIWERCPTHQEVQDMKYLDLLIKETQRLYPSVPMIARNCDEEFNLNGKKIPKNTTITIFIMAMGYNEKYFKDPYKIDVERFNRQSTEKVNPFGYVPFSAGPRNCIGQKYAILEMKAMISRIVRHYEILPPEDNMDELRSKIYEPILATALTLKSENGIQIRLRKRTSY